MATAEERAAAAAEATGVQLGSSKPMVATQEEMVAERVPIAYRDECAHLLIPLNRCRRAEFFLQWKCERERHAYEKCEYELVMERMLQMQMVRKSQQQGTAKATVTAGLSGAPSTAKL